MIIVIIIFAIIFYIAYKNKRIKDVINQISYKDDEERGNKEEDLLYPS